NDGFIDIFVANDYAGGDYMYINQGNGTFKEQVKSATNHISLFSMGADVSDINNDGLEDIMVMEMRPEDYVRSKVSMPSMDVEGFYAIVNEGMHKQYMHNMLHLNQGNLFFSEISQLSGIAQTDWSWAVLASDFTNSGNRDLLVTNGFRRDVFDGDTKQRLATYLRENKDKYRTPQELFGKGFKEFIEVYKPVKVRNYLFRNDGKLRFDDVSSDWGFEDKSFSNGAAVADLDGDGDLDIIVNNLEEEAFIYENTSPFKNNYLKIKLQGPEKNTLGLGAKVTLYSENEIQYFENKIVRGYLSSCEPVVHFGVGQKLTIDSLKVQWNDGRENVLKEIKSNQLLVVDYSNAQQNNRKAPKKTNQFNEVTKEIFVDPFTHKENVFNEFSEQVLLPHMFSRSGPFISVGDVNHDNEEDFFIGGATGQAGRLYIQKNGKLVRKFVPDFEKDMRYEDMGSLFFDANQDGHLDLYVVSGGSEYREGHELYQDRLYLNDGAGNFKKTALPEIRSSGSSVVAHDINGDGKLDIFVGGTVVMGDYPKAPRSYLLINEGGKFVDRTKEIGPGLANVGMVNSAIWADVTGDKAAELIVVGEWMPVKVFANKNGRLEDISVDLGLAETHGWWNKVIAEDLNGDGKLDLLIGNQGENYKFKPTHEKPLHVFAKDFDRNGTNDIFLAKMNKEDLVPVRGKECTSMQMPVISQKFPSFQSFAEADLKDILGKDMDNALHLFAYNFSSVILINDEGKFTEKKLPVEAQFSAINSLIVEDFNGDGRKDILVAGNKFDSEVETTPADGSQGLLLENLGDFEFKSIRGMDSGFSVPYNVK
ncbi:MAG: VCBS repeat-containing protein, partial [Bacteroidota bacterium]|nr:VCBS repeat-containing protein [Bacteroidota bacterium]